MNKLLKTIEENDENIKSHITQSRIKELEALVEMIEDKKQGEFFGTNIDNPKLQEYEDDCIAYNESLADIIQELKTIIKLIKKGKLKTNIKYLKTD